LVPTKKKFVRFQPEELISHLGWALLKTRAPLLLLSPELFALEKPLSLSLSLSLSLYCISKQLKQIGQAESENGERES